jgi:hypothetical protein
LSEVARAETEARVLDRRTKAEVERQRLLTRQEVERRQELNRVDVDKHKQLDQVAIAKEKAQAVLTAENPTYADPMQGDALAVVAGGARTFSNPEHIGARRRLPGPWYSTNASH